MHLHFIHDFKYVKAVRKFVDGWVLDHHKIFYAALFECQHKNCKAYKVAWGHKYINKPNGLFGIPKNIKPKRLGVKRGKY